MTTISASPADTSATSTATAGRRTVDAATRAFHWLFALCFAGAYLTADGERWRLVHVTLGYTMVGLLVARILWGLIGPRRVRLSIMLGKLKSAPGLNWAMTAAIVGVLMTVALTTATGYVTYQELTGDWMEEVHEFVGNGLLALVLGHIALVLGLSALRQRNLVLPMVTGRTPGRGPDLVKHNFTWLAALLLTAVLGFWAWQWQNAPTGAGLDQGASASSAMDSDDDEDDD